MTCLSRVGCGLTLATLALGCGGGPHLYAVDGAVTVAGQPVPAGMIIFEPDLSKGPDGPRGNAPIKNGRYDSRFESGSPPMAGAMRVRILGYNGRPHGELPFGDLICDHDTEIDLPARPSTHDFNVPAGSTG